ncbi:MAG TPA: periplasmic heavy metal sensor [Thermoanaerobaculia bacterium]|nr:periplasmic heavy metal sensor [Thermoanaerobaculia bacterium]
MKKILLGLCAVLAVLIVAGVAMAGDRAHGRGPGIVRMHHQQFAEELNLTEEQQASVRQIHEDLRTRTEPVMEQLHQQMEDLEALLDTANPNPTEVGSKAIAAHATRTQLKALHDDFKTRFQALLTDEQKAKLAEIEAEHGDEGGPHVRFMHHRGPGR